MAHTDINIWQSFLSGDKFSFEELMKTYYEVLFNYGSKYAADKELIKDCIQELFIGLWTRRHNLSQDVNPKAYLIASFRRSLHRKIQSEKKILQAGEVPGNFDFELSIEEKIIYNENDKLLAYKLKELIENLPERQKEVIYLKFFVGLNRDEIAEIMGNKPQTVSNLLQMAFKTLRIKLKDISVAKIALMITAFCFK